MSGLFGSYIEEDVEQLNEVTVYAEQKKIYIGITADTGRGFEKAPYFKVSWKPIDTRNNDVARISMVDGQYVTHYGYSVKLDTEKINQINAILKGSLTEKRFINYKNVWTALLASCTEQCNCSFDQLKANFPIKTINPDPKKLSGCTVIKWGK